MKRQRVKIIMPENKKIVFTDHLEELRNRILKSVGVVVLCSCVSMVFAKKIIEYLIIPIDKLVFIAPQEAFITNIVVALWSGLFFAAPFVFFQIWKFISLGLNANEEKYVLAYGPVSFVLFVLGVCFGYFVIVPVGLKFLLGFSSDTIVPMITLSKYISFIGLLTLNFGIVFELPIAIIFLTKIGIVTPEILINKRRHAVVLLFVAAAIFTPPDVISQALMAFPLIFLFEIGIICSKAVCKKR